jgi:hypothetical protein
MEAILKEDRFDYVVDRDKKFILAFNDEMTRLGYDFGDKIGSGFCWGRHMIIYTKAGVKSKTVFARIYMKEAGIVLRLFLNKIDRHRQYIEHSPSNIKEVFVGNDGTCQHCHNEKDGLCQFRKTYTLEDRFIEKCNGSTFEFHNLSIHEIKEYIALFTEFFPQKKDRQSLAT